MKAPKLAGVPSVRLSVAGTVPPASWVTLVAERISGACAVFHTVAPPLLTLTAQWMTLPTSSAVGVYVSPSPTSSESVHVRACVP